MPAGDSIEWGREYADAEVSALSEARRPKPSRPFAIATPATGQGRGLQRRSGRGDKWCPFCQTPLNPAARAQSCARCKPRREQALDRLRNAQTAQPAPSASQRLHQDIANLLDRIDEMGRVVGVAYSMRARNGGMTAEHAEDILVAAKDVMVGSDPLRRGLRGPREAGGRPGPASSRVQR